jgi:hypothetical protein
MMLFQDGKQLWRQSGVLTKEEIIKIILDKTNSNEPKPINKDFKRKNWHYNELYLLTNLLFSILRTAMYFLIAGLSRIKIENSIAIEIVLFAVSVLFS